MIRYSLLYICLAVLLSACGGSTNTENHLGGVDFGNPAAPDTSSGQSAFSTSLVFVEQDWTDGFHSADVNSDGKIDMIVSGNPQIMLGNGDGTFRPGQNFDSAVGFRNLQSSDLNKDGKVDLVYKQYLTSHISVRYGKGDGTFGSRIDLPSGAYKNADIKIGDMNEDGFDDIVALNADNSNSSIRDCISIHLNDGASGFKAPTVVSTPMNNSWIIHLVDLNNDRHLDVISEHSEQVGTHTYIGDGNGKISAGVSTQQSTGGYSLVVGDFNQDEKVDYLVHFASTVSISLGFGSGQFGAAFKADLNMNAFDNSGMRERPVLADLDEDGALDLITTDNTLGLVSIHRGRGDGTFKTIGTLKALPGALAIEAADFDNDGTLDIAVKAGGRKSVAEESRPVSIFMNVAKSDLFK